MIAGVTHIYNDANGQSALPQKFNQRGVTNMRLNRNLAMILLAVFLILYGVAGLGIFSFAAMDTVAAICALAAGILILVNR